MNILFIIPPYFDADDLIDNQKSAVLPAFTIPYGILSLDAYIGAHCSKPVRVRVLDLNTDLRRAVSEGKTADYRATFSARVSSECRSFLPDVVGISALFNSSFKYLEHTARVAKDSCNDAVVLSGGGLPSAAYSTVLLHCPSIDGVCKGEGELPLQALVDAADPYDCLQTHPAWITREGLAKGKTPQLDLVQDLDAIPPLNYSIVDLADYNSRSIDKRFAGVKRREMSVHTSRGCPFRCVFCSNPSLHGRKVRAMSVDRVVADVRRMKDDSGMDVLMIEDDHFLHDIPRAKRLLQRLVELNVRIEFPNGVAVYAIDEEVAELLSKAGVSSVALAVESGSDHVLNNIIRKPLTKSMIKPAVEHLRSHGVLAHVFVVIGLPGEMPEHREETLEMLLATGFDWVHPFCAVPIFGSRLYDICLENGYIEDSDSENYVATKSVIRAPGVDPEEIERFAYRINLTVNFVENHNMNIGRYTIAEDYFRNVVDKYPGHLFGQFYLAKALMAQGKEGWQVHQELSRDIFETDPWWRETAAAYGLGGEDFMATPEIGLARRDGSGQVSGPSEGQGR